MTTLVTGGVGFVGANIVKELARAGHQVVCLDLNGPDRILEKFIGELGPRVSFVQADMLDRAVLVSRSAFPYFRGRTNTSAS